MVGVMRVRMLEDRAAAVDGVSVTRLRAGDVVELPDSLATRYVARGFAQEVDVKSKGAAPEDKAAAPKPPRRRGRPRKTSADSEE